MYGIIQLFKTCDILLLNLSQFFNCINKSDIISYLLEKQERMYLLILEQTHQEWQNNYRNNKKMIDRNEIAHLI